MKKQEEGVVHNDTRLARWPVVAVAVMAIVATILVAKFFATNGWLWAALAVTAVPALWLTARRRRSLTAATVSSALGVVTIIVAVAAVVASGAFAHPTDVAAQSGSQSGDQAQSASATAPATTGGGSFDGTNVGIQNSDGTTAVQLPLYNGDGKSVLTVDSTSDSNIAPLLDFSQRYTANTLTWAGFVNRVGSQQGFKDGIDEYSSSSQLGFSWEDAKKFASVNYEDANGKVAGVNALAIQVVNITSDEMSDDEVRAQVAQYITPEIQAQAGISVDELPIQRISGGLVNTQNSGTTDSIKVSAFFDTEKMIRVSLMPIIFDATGKPTGLDGTNGAGIFIDCGNPHWVPQLVWTCTSNNSCAKPVERPTYTPPTYTPPAYTPPSNPNNPNNPNNSKDWSTLASKPSGVVQLNSGPLTSSGESAAQKANGETAGNATDSKVPEGTTSDSVTPDYTSPSVAPVAPGATQGGDSSSTATTDANANHDDGATNGTGESTDPDDR